MSQSDLDLLVLELEKECEKLRTLFDLCLETMDYHNAALYNEIFFLKKAELMRMQELKIRDFRNSFRMSMDIARYKKRLSNIENDPKNQSFFDGKLSAKKSELADFLSNVKPHLDSDYLVQAIDNLLNDKYFVVEILLDESANLKIVLAEYSKGFQINIKFDPNHYYKFQNEDESRYQLNKLGFKFVEEEIFLNLGEKNNVNADEILLLLSRIIFEAFAAFDFKQVKLNCMR